MTKTYLTLLPSNRFAFTCPVFDAKVEMRTCVHIRDKVYRGQRLQTRRGCQACIASSKCPAAEIIRRIAFGASDATDHCGSVEEKHGRLPADVLERVSRVLVKESDLMAFNVPTGERECINSATARIEAQMATAPREKVEARRAMTSDEPAPRRSAPKPVQRGSAPRTTEPTTINKAAATGDLTAALNVA